MFSPRFTVSVTLVLSLFLTVESADAQQSGLQITPSVKRNIPSRHYYAVIGAVGVPGVYEYSSGLPTLADVTHAADGLTSEASGTFRIVREGKASRQMFYSPDSKMRLLSGDILILDKSPSGTQGGGRPSTYVGSQSLVHIVAVNLIHRPVVLSLPSENATLENLVALLNQNPNIIATVKFLQAKTSEYIGPGRDLAKFRLISNSVLIFDSSAVRIDQIPDLPPVYQPKVTTASHRQMRGVASEGTLSEKSQSVIQLAAGSSSQNKSSQLDQVDKMFWVSPALQNVPQHKTKPAYEIPEGWTPVDTEGLSTKPPADGWKIPLESPRALHPSDPLAFLPDEKIISDSAENSAVPEETSEIIIPLKSMALQGFITAGCVGLLTVGWLFRRKLQQRIKPQFDYQPVKKKTEGILDALIENKLSLVEEPFIFPEGLELPVPAVAPISRRKIRVDSSHKVRKPHLPSVVEEPEPDTSRSVTKTTQIDATPETPLVVSGLSEPVEMIQLRRDVPLSESLPESIEAKTEIDQTRFPETEPYTAYVYSTAWPEPASVSEPVVEIRSETPGRNESDSLSSEQIKRIDSPQTPSSRPHTRSSGWVLDRVLVALHGVTRQ
jgi:hypothetical protein